MTSARLVPLASALLVTACAVAPTPDEPRQAPVTAASATPVASTADVLGQWDIVSFEGYQPASRVQGSTRTAFADFAEDGVGLRIECNWSGASGRVVDGRFRPDQTGPRAQTAMGCGEVRESRDARLFGFFDLSPTVERLSDGRLRIAADGRDLILQRPAQRRLDFLPKASELQGAWRLEILTNHYPQGGHAAIGLQEIPGRIVVSGDRLGYSRCPQFDLTFRYTHDGRLEKAAGPDLPDEAVGCPELARPSGMRDFPPTVWPVMEILHANPLVERSGDDRVVLSAGDYAIEMTKAPCREGEPCAPL